MKTLEKFSHIYGYKILLTIPWTFTDLYFLLNAQ